MKLLILGGTTFIGRHMIDAALARGHEVTLFNRGRTNADLYPQVEKLRGDRDGDLGALQGRTWDAVIDNCGYVPRIVRQSAELLKDAVQRYVFISSLSVYSETDKTDIDESGALVTLEDESTEEVMAAYGGLKVLCEQVVQDIYRDRALIIRPGLIVGPHDPTNRFTYWPVRMADAQRNGGEVLAPDDPERGMQFIDVRDLAEWVVTMAEKGSGVYNATGPHLTFGTLLDTCQQVAGTDLRLTWVSEAFLLENDVAPYMEMPLWVPRAMAAFDTFNIDKAVHAGLTFRPLDVTVQDTLDWARSSGEPAPHPLGRPRGGMSAEREADLLAAWRAE